ncbi:E3 ubiquitin-protein ligase LRSAM1-like isoform X1 [Leptopilina heterotoma]|uniref:E3 ubiquitin-protein ligase LRSAM1-like isoform X1 n=1 Tax=Leptopilina heterotoma TaxID=63436 RepID=UPI001CA93500|nr:E3 ubiquitin-protein ligase LRSAM1-like isoform X1 [Leptopilina heterotoma]
MPLSKTRTTMSNKARLEHKLYLARENPEPVFDISECSLKQVPSGTYTLCKVFRKRTLLLNNNKLSSLAGGGALSDLSLLTILDLSSNELNSLPSDVRNLVSLEKLFLQDNNLKRLPNEIVNLGNLNVLNVSKNNLKELPELLGELRKLTILNISFNKAIKCLPKSLGYAQKIIQLEIDGLNHLSYPPKDILDGGAIVIIAFLSIECGIEYNPEETFVETEQIKNVNSEQVKTFYQNKDNDTQATLILLAKAKEQRQSALLEVERNMKEQKELELGLQSMLKNNKKKLLEDLVLQQSQLEQEIVKVQQERDVNKAKLLSHIYDAEKEADAVIKQFLKTSEEERLTQATLTEQEKREEMQLLNASCSQHLLRTKDTLMSMEELLKEELLRENRLAEYAKFRDYNARSLLSIEVKNNDNLMQIMKNQERNRQDLVERLRKDEALQKAAVAALLELSDARSWSIVQQVNLVQSQLATLTNIELERRKLEMNQQLNDIADKRVTLSAILLDLLEQQEKRREELLDTIKHIEEYRDTSPTRRSSLFWLMQYQSLMDARPQGLLETLEPTLVRHVAIAGVLHCLPFLTTLPSMLPDIDDEQLKAIGINSDVDRAAIKLAAENYLSEKKLNSHEPIIIPSAPIDDHPSAPPEEAPCTSTSIQENTQRMNTTECVVCMDSQCDIIFFPCGHLCCCAICTEMITSECPMCRSEITRKIRVIQP